jgi:hypothetical protein
MGSLGESPKSSFRQRAILRVEQQKIAVANNWFPSQYIRVGCDSISQCHIALSTAE